MALENGLIDAIGGEAEALAWLESQQRGLADLPVEDWEVERDAPVLGRVLGKIGASSGILGEISLLSGPKLYSIGP
jgi:ClpP class serine protease